MFHILSQPRACVIDGAVFFQNFCETLMQIENNDEPRHELKAYCLKHVPNYQRMSELLFVLRATLTSIGDRWSDGQGPLALQFSASEIRQLTRALFQNTERRANLLASIH